ncbi:kinase suppressor of Ras 2 [Pseudomyrmex gracilis]|uniref:kinase suppressor of Ras 2 n=1 Tax=Pseudomyrmex gracilis TaxID=219809 RepID=UPI00099581FF|nr:kinase suppressor of Ras 2 [Pseudomyrmex gracilis]
MADGEDEEPNAVYVLNILQDLIDVSAERLEGLRTQCSTSAELTQQEIRTLEGKLIKLYTKQLVTKAKLADSLQAEMKHCPSLRQWLSVVGLTQESIQMVCSEVNSLEDLKEKSEYELGCMLGKNNVRYDEELRKLCKALYNLRRYMDVVMREDVETCNMDLYWDSWDKHHLRTGASPRPVRSRATRCSVPSKDSIPYQNNNNLNSDILAQPSSVMSPSPPRTPPLLKQRCEIKLPITPPTCKKHQIGVQSSTSQPEVFPLTKSKSHESQLANRLEHTHNDNTSLLRRRNRLPTEPSSSCSTTDSRKAENLLPNSSSSKPSPYYSTETDETCFKGTASLQVPKSPRTRTVTRAMGHIIAHRFIKTFFVITTCDYCDKQMFGPNLKCVECKYKCHQACESKVPPSCGLPQELFNEFKRAVQNDGMIDPASVLNQHSVTSPNTHSQHVSSLPLARKDRRQSHTHSSINTPFQGADSSSNTSSCNSSTPSSPALLPANTSQTPQASVKQQQFHFPDILNDKRRVTFELPRSDDAVMLSDNEKTITTLGSGSINTNSERIPVRNDSQDSQVSDSDISVTNRNQASMQEWDIPYDELKIGEPIGTGRFGTVYRGNWHGDVAIKVLNMDCSDNDKILKAFRLEVATFRKTRHENLVLFMGACMKPPRLAIVTSLSKGMTLYTHIHLRKDRFGINKITNIAQQICQGMGYLHARGIIHKDLKSKNIFLEHGKIIITDFGLLNVTKLCYGNGKANRLNIPPGWLCYLAPEIVQRLTPQQNRDQKELPFTAASDVYAFGTVWYELLCGEWPFKGEPPEAIIWRVGTGMMHTLANLEASEEVKDILMLCWSYQVEKRPDFPKLLTILEKLPRKRLERSPSHPIQLSRSAESVL